MFNAYCTTIYIGFMQNDEAEELFEKLVSYNSHEIGELLSDALLRKYPDIARGRWHISFEQLFQWKMWPKYIQLIRTWTTVFACSRSTCKWCG